MDTDNSLRHRRRVPKSCLACLTGKRACDRAKPTCTRCHQKQQKCVYPTNPTEKPRRARNVQTGDSKIEEEVVLAGIEHPNNGNVQTLWYGEPVKGSDIFQLKESEPTLCKTTINGALDQLLNPATDLSGKEIWASKEGDFKMQLLPLLPNAKRNRRNFEEIRRFLRSTMPALLEENTLQMAEELLSEGATKEIVMNIPLPWLAVLCISCALGHEFTLVRGEEEKEIMMSPSQLGYSDTMKMATRHALILSNCHTSPTLHTIYAQLLLGLFYIHTERAANYWSLFGAVVRQAQALGLDKAPGLNKNEEIEELRERLWWSIMQQDVLLSSIFGRPLAISCFSRPVSQKSKGIDSGMPRCLDIHVQFSVLERRHLMEDLYQGWDINQLKDFRREALDWYLSLPHDIRIDIDEHGFVQGDVKSQMINKSTSAIEATFDQFIKLQYMFLSLYRNRLNSSNHALNEESHLICSQAIHNIVISLDAIVELLGILQAGNVWARVFYAFHTGVTAAYLRLSKPGTELASRAMEDLSTLQSICQRLPQRWRGLKTVNDTFAVLSAHVDSCLMRQTQVQQWQQVTDESCFSLSCPSLSTSPSRPTLSTSSLATDYSTPGTSNSNTCFLNNESQEAASNEYGAPSINWTGTFPEPFGATTTLPPPASDASGEEILAFWSQFFSKQFPPNSNNVDLQFA